VSSATSGDVLACKSRVLHCVDRVLCRSVQELQGDPAPHQNQDEQRLLDHDPKPARVGLLLQNGHKPTRRVHNLERRQHEFRGELRQTVRLQFTPIGVE
jgi:hypothetical protein